MFGITEDDIYVSEAIHTYGYDVEEAYRLYREGKLCKHLSGLLDWYEDKLKAEREDFINRSNKNNSHCY